MTPPRWVVALGGNALTPPAGDPSLAVERARVDATAAELAALAADHGARLLVVHGNGPQVGRLLALDRDVDALDVRVAQTQGELGLLLVSALDGRLGQGACAALLTRVVVDADDPAFAAPTKPVGPVLSAAPAGVPAARTPDGRGWRRVVASPRPLAVVDAAAVVALLGSRHVVAGGGGGVAVDARGRPRPAVVDKDWTAALLALAVGAERLLFVTDVPCAFDDFAGAAEPIARMTAAEARDRLAHGVFAPGSMAPKVESAVLFVEATGREAVITTVGSVAAGLAGRSGTTVVR